MTDTRVRFSAEESVSVAPREAFLLFTEHVGEWYEITPYSVINPDKTASVAIEGFAGGRFLEVWRDAQPGGVLGTVRVWDPPQRFMFVDLNNCEVEVTFEPITTGSRVTIAVRVPEETDRRRTDTIRQYGWHTLLTQYVSFTVNKSNNGSRT